jgi:hypothetical protein
MDEMSTISHELSDRNHSHIMSTTQLLQMFLVTHQKSSSLPSQPYPKSQLSSATEQVLPRASASSAAETSVAWVASASLHDDDDGVGVGVDGTNEHGFVPACAVSSALAPKDVHLADTDAKAVVMAKASSQIAEE